MVGSGMPADFALTFETHVKFKAVMVAKNLTRAQTKCPKCGVENALQGALLGKKKHLHMACKTPECIRSME